MTLKLTTEKNLYPVSEYLPELKSNLEARATVPEMPINSIPSLNDKLWGLRRRKFYIIAARPSIGKSAFSLQIAYDIACQGKNVLVLSLEMTVQDMLERLFCYEYKIDNQQLDRGNFKAHAASFDTFCRKLNSTKLVLSDCIGREFEEIEQILDKITVKPDVIFVDHLNAIKTSGFNTKMDIDQYIINLNTIAKKHNLVMVLCCQINRASQDDKDKTPHLHDLKGSGNLEEMADVVMLLHWPWKYKSNKTKNIRKSDFVVIIGKNRNGPTGYVELDVKPECYTYSDPYNRPPQADEKKTIKEKDINWMD